MLFCPPNNSYFTMDRFGDYDVYNPYDLDNYGIVNTIMRVG
jgi:hypothetical protein